MATALRSTAKPYSSSGKIYAWRREAVEAYIENLIALLDQMDGDENLEPSLAGFDELSMDDRENEDEHGGDIHDEPHDDGDDSEPSLGWANPMGRTVQELGEMPADELDYDPARGVSLRFDGSGVTVAETMVKNQLTLGR